MTDYQKVARPRMDTGILGQTAPPTAEALARMQQSPYVWRAAGGALRRVAAERVLLPADPTAHPQNVHLFKGADAAIYVRQNQILCKSIDGGRSWTSRPVEGMAGACAVLRDGSLLRVHAEEDRSAARVLRSDDEAETWTEIATFALPAGYAGGSAYGITHLADGGLLCDIKVEDSQYGIAADTRGQELRLLSGLARLLAYRSMDGGRTWEGPAPIVEFSGEGGSAALASGRLLAVKRHQRGLLPAESVELLDEFGVNEVFARLGKLPNRIFKNIVLADSDDGGKSWHNQRLLTTVFGQCFGFPAAQSDGTVAVVHDTRYGPGPDCARALISRDEGQTWENEAYYLFYGTGASGYSHSTVLADDTILTVCGTSDYTEGDARKWHNWTGHAQFTALRWKPVKD